MDPAVPSRTPVPALLEGRLFIVGAAVLWSFSGGFGKVLTRDTPLGLHTPPIEPLLIAFYRAFFAGLVLVPTLRRGDFSFRPAMVPMAISFAAMNALFVSALTLGSAANAIWLQYTAPLWMYLASVYWLKEPVDRRASQALVAGLIGIGVIVLGGWHEAQLMIIAVALGSGAAYAGVVLGLRFCRGASPRWLTIWNHMSGALVLLPLAFVYRQPTWSQLCVLFLFGAIQMAMPYWLMARGLQTVSAQEAGIITLLEPLLNPIWAYVVAGEAPSRFTLVGGACILGGLFWRYWPWRRA
jgi:drug/metabolite transporter (DMT)-like permease